MQRFSYNTVQAPMIRTGILIVLDLNSFQNLCLEQCFSIFAILGVEVHMFWELKSTDVKIVKIEKHCTRTLPS